MTFKKGDIVRMHSWHGVVIDIFENGTENIVLKVQTARNVFRKLPPELIELDAAPNKISLASPSDLQTEIERHQSMQQNAIEALWASVPQVVG